MILFQKMNPIKTSNSSSKFRKLKRKVVRHCWKITHLSIKKENIIERQKTTTENRKRGSRCGIFINTQLLKTDFLQQVQHNEQKRTRSPDDQVPKSLMVLSSLLVNSSHDVEINWANTSSKVRNTFYPAPSSFQKATNASNYRYLAC